MLKFARKNPHGRSSSADRDRVGSRIPVRMLEQCDTRDFSPVRKGRRQKAAAAAAAAEVAAEAAAETTAATFRSSSVERGQRRSQQTAAAFDRDVTPRELRQLHQVYHLQQQLQRRQLQFQEEQHLLLLDALPSPPPLVRRANTRPVSTRLAASPLSSPSSSSDDYSDYQQLSSGTLCRRSHQQQLQLAPMTPTLEKLSSLGSTMPPPPPPPPKPKSVLKKGSNSSNGNSPRPAGRYTFHRDVERLVAKLDLLPAILDSSSSESGYGSADDHDSLASRTSSSSRESSNSSSTASPPPIPKRPRHTPNRRVRFDSYVLLLQSLRDRDPPHVVRAHLREVRRPEALRTDEVLREFVACVSEGRADLAAELLGAGCDPNAAVAEPGGVTTLHLAAAFNSLPLVKLLLHHGAAVFARTHSTGRTPSEMPSPIISNSGSSSSSSSGGGSNNGNHDYESCRAYLRCMEECLGVAESGRAFAVRPHRTCRRDELSLEQGEELRVLRRGDYPGSAWWWCGKVEDGEGEVREGYVLRDLLCGNKPTCCQVRQEDGEEEQVVAGEVRTK